MNTLSKAIVVGFLVVVIGNIVGFIVGRFLSVDLPVVCKDWNKNHVMDISLFFTGVALILVRKYTWIKNL